MPRSHIVLPNALAVDVAAQTVTLPLQKGHVGNKTLWYIVTDSSNASDAKTRGAIRVGSSNGEVSFVGAPDFSKKREFVAGPTGFLPKKAAPGATAPSSYSPFIRIGSAATEINAPIVATGSGPFDVTTHLNTHPREVAQVVVGAGPARIATVWFVTGSARGFGRN